MGSSCSSGNSSIGSHAVSGKPFEFVDRGGKRVNYDGDPKIDGVPGTAWAQ